MARLEPGQPAPDFTLPSDGGDDVTLSSLRGAPVVLVFYPKAMTSGCTQQACAYRDSLGQFEGLGATVLAQSAAVLGVPAISRLFSFSSPQPLLLLKKSQNAQGLHLMMLP